MIHFSHDRPSTDEIRDALTEKIDGVRHYNGEQKIELIGYKGEIDDAVNDLEEAGYNVQS